MARVDAAFTDAAKRAVRIGFDAIELHCAHGYLLHSFVSPLSNKRNDAYGGSLEGRMRFPLEVARAVRAAVPRAVPLGARITGTDWLDGGLTGDDAVALAKALKDAGLDYIDISSGNITARQPLADRSRLQRADRRAGAPRDRHRHPRRRHDRGRQAGRGTSSPRARPTWWRWRAPSSTIRIGAGTRRRRSAPRWRGRRNMRVRRRSYGRARLYAGERGAS